MPINHFVLFLTDKGQLKTSLSPRGSGAHPHLPPDEEHEDCFIVRPQEMCGHAGDVRAAEQPGLTCIHTMFFRQVCQLDQDQLFFHSL